MTIDLTAHGRELLQESAELLQQLQDKLEAVREDFEGLYGVNPGTPRDLEDTHAVQLSWWLPDTVGIMRTQIEMLSCYFRQDGEDGDMFGHNPVVVQSDR